MCLMAATNSINVRMWLEDGFCQKLVDDFCEEHFQIIYICIAFLLASIVCYNTIDLLPKTAGTASCWTKIIQNSRRNNTRTFVHFDRFRKICVVASLCAMQSNKIDCTSFLLLFSNIPFLLHSSSHLFSSLSMWKLWRNVSGPFRNPSFIYLQLLYIISFYAFIMALFEWLEHLQQHVTIRKV